LNKVKKFLDNLEGYFCVLALLAMSLIVFIQVICRFVLKSSLPWSEEASRYLLVWTAFLGGAYGIRQGAHIGVEAFSLLLPKKIQEILSILVMIVSIILCAIIFEYGISIVGSLLSKGQLSPAMRIPMGYIYAAIPVGMVFFIIRYFQCIYMTIKNLNEDEKEEVGE